MRYFLFLLTSCAIAILTFHSSAESQGKKKARTPIYSETKDVFGDFLPIGALSRIGTVRYRLPEGRQPETAILSPDGTLLAAFDNNNQIDLWELPAWVKRATLKTRGIDKNNPPFFQSFVFSSDNKRILIGDGNRNEAYLLDLATGMLVKKFAFSKNDKDQNNVGNIHVLLSRDQKTLVRMARVNLVNGQMLKFTVWDAENDKQRHAFEIPANRFDGQSNQPALSADGRWLVQNSGTETMNGRNERMDSFLDVWDLTAGKSVRRIDTEMSMRSLTISPDGKWLAASDGMSCLRFFEVATGKELHNIRLRRCNISHLEFTPDSSSLYVAEYAGAISQWNPATGERIVAYKAAVPGANVRNLAFLPDGSVRALGIGFEAIHYWDVKTGKVMSPTGVPTGFIDDLNFAPNGDLFVASEDGQAAWWNPRTAVKVRDLKIEFNDDQNFFGRGLHYNLDRRELFEGSFQMPRRGGAMQMSRSGDFLTSGDGGGTGFYDVKTGKILYDESGNSNGIPNLVSFIEGGHKVASIQQKKIRVFSTRTGRDESVFDLPLQKNEQTIRMAASPNAKFFAVGTTSINGEQAVGRGLLWDAEKNRLAREWNTQNQDTLMLFSPDNQWLAVASTRAQIRLTRVASPRGDHTLDLGADGDEINTLAFSPDGRLLACGIIVPSRNTDVSRIYVVEMASKKIRQELVGHPGGIIDRLSWSHDGALLASGATDTTVLVWSAGLRALAEKRADKDASAEELNDWFDQLAGPNPKAVFQHMVKYARTPTQAVKHLGEKIEPAKKPDTGGKAVAQWINELGSTTFPVRNRANGVLLSIGAAAEPSLRAALPNAKDVETKRRIEDLLDRIALNQWTTEEIRHARAVEVLEAIGSSEARAVLTRWTTGDAGAVLTREARQALASLK